MDILAAIDAAVGCQQCGGPLGDTPPGVLGGSVGVGDDEPAVDLRDVGDSPARPGRPLRGGSVGADDDAEVVALPVGVGEDQAALPEDGPGDSAPGRPVGAGRAGDDADVGGGPDDEVSGRVEAGPGHPPARSSDGPGRPGRAVEAVDAVAEDRGGARTAPGRSRTSNTCSPAPTTVGP